jgi:hypothetical protein
MGKVSTKKPKGVGGGRSNFKQSMRLEHAKFGQHLLKNPLIVDGMVERAAVRSTDTVLEASLFNFKNYIVLQFVIFILGRSWYWKFDNEASSQGKESNSI